MNNAKIAKEQVYRTIISIFSEYNGQKRIKFAAKRNFGIANICLLRGDISKKKLETKINKTVTLRKALRKQKGSTIRNICTYLTYKETLLR